MKRGLGLYAAALYAFLHLPLVILTVFSFNSSKFTVWEGFSLRWYRAVLSDPNLAEAALNSVEIAIASTILSTIVGDRLRLRLLEAPRPPAVRRALSFAGHAGDRHGVSLLAFFQWTFRFLHWRLGLHTVILAHVAFSIAYVVIVVAARLRTLDASLEEAAMDLGATEWGAFRLVTLPALLPGIAAAAMLALTVSFDDYVITSMVAGVDSETLPMWIYATARRGANPAINAISAIIVVFFGALILLSERLRSPER